jgi:hypothetical protein
VQMFRLLYDRTAAAQTEKEAQETLSKGTDPKKAKANLHEVKGVVGELHHELVKLGEAFVAAFSIHKIIGFFEASVHAAAENEHSMHQLETAVHNAGSSFEQMEPAINANLEALYNHSRFTRVELRAAFGNLVQLTGSVDKAMRSMGVTVDFATGRNIELGQAATLVGRYLTGNTNALTRYIGKTAEGVNVMERLQKTFADAAANEMKSYEGRILTITKAKNDLLVTIGELIIGDTSLGGSMTNVADAIKSATQWVKNNRAELGSFISAIATAVTWLGKLAGVLTYDLGQAFKGAQILIIGLVEGIQELPARWDLALASTKQILGGWIDDVSGLLDKLGIHTLDNIGARMQAQSKVVIANARKEIGDLQDALDKTTEDILNPSEGPLLKHKTEAGGGGGPLPTAAPDPKKLEHEFDLLMQQHKAEAEMANENILLGRDVQSNMAVLAAQEEFFRQTSEDSTKTMKQRNDALREQLAIQKDIIDEQAREEALREFFAGENNVQLKSESQIQAGIRSHLGPGPNEGVSDQKMADIQEYGKVIGTILDGIDEDASRVAESIYDAFYNSLNHLTLSFKGLGQAVAGIFKGTAKAILAELQAEAKGQAIHDAAAAIQQLAWGLARSAVGDAAGAALHYESAKTFALSALEWGGAALAEGALLGGQGGGSGGGAGSLTSGTGGNTKAGEPARGQIHIYLDGVDPLNPRHQELIGEANKRFGDTGGYDVIYHPGRRSA